MHQLVRISPEPEDGYLMLASPQVNGEIAVHRKCLAQGYTAREWLSQHLIPGLSTVKQHYAC